MRTKIIAGFPGIGKTEAVKALGDRASDSDSSQFSWTYDSHGKKRHPDFPKNYVEHIKSLIGKKEFIFVSTHKDVRDALLDNCLFFYLVYPQVTAKAEYVERYKARGNDEKFISFVEREWEEWIRQLDEVGQGCHKIKMLNPYLMDEMQIIGD